MKYIIYCRKSSEAEDRQALSLESQESELLSLAKQEGFEVVRIMQESRSAKSLGRPVFKEVIDLISNGKADAILCWKLDRLARNPVDAGMVSMMLQENKLKCIRTFERVYLPTDNVLMMSVEFGMANQYVRDLSQNIKRGNRTKLERGGWPNHAPFGYLNSKADKSITVDPVRAPHVITAFNLYATGGYNLQQITDILFVNGLRSSSGKKVFKSSVHRIIQDPFYYGVMTREGRCYQGNHQPLISKEVFDRAQSVLNGNLRSKAKTHFFPLRGFMRCEVCGCMLTAARKKGHPYYYCTNGKGICSQHTSYIRSEVLEKQVGGIFEKIHFDERIINIMYKSAKEKTERSSGHLQAAVNHLQERLNSSQEKQRKLLESYLAKQTPEALYSQKITELHNDEISIQAELKVARQKLEQGFSTLEPIKDIFLRAHRAKKEFLEGDDYKKREMLEIVLWNLTVKNKKVEQYQLKKPYQRLLKRPKRETISNLLRGLDLNQRPLGYAYHYSFHCS
jgi:site-specific DNA recombinase